MFVKSQNEKFLKNTAIAIIFIFLFVTFASTAVMAKPISGTGETDDSYKGHTSSSSSSRSSSSSSSSSDNDSSDNDSNSGWNDDDDDDDDGPSAAEIREEKKKGFFEKIADGIKKVAGKMVDTIKNPIDSVKNAVPDIVDGIKKAAGSAKRLVTGEGGLEEIGNMLAVGFGGAVGAYLIGDGEGSINISGSGLASKNNCVGPDCDDGEETEPEDPFHGNTHNSGNKNNSISNISNGSGGSTGSYTPDYEYIDDYEGGKVSIDKTGLTAMNNGYYKPVITDVNMQVGLASNNFNAEVLSHNDKVQETQKNIDRFVTAYTVFEKKMEEIENDKKAILKEIENLKQYDRQKALELEKLVKGSNEVKKLDFNRYAKDQGWITEKKEYAFFKENDGKDNQKDKQAYLKEVRRIKENNKKELEKLKAIQKENEQIKRENEQIENFNKEQKEKFDRLVDQQRKINEEYNNYINEQEKLEEKINKAIRNKDQEEYDRLKKQFTEKEYTAKRKLGELRKITEEINNLKNAESDIVEEDKKESVLRENSRSKIFGGSSGSSFSSNYDRNDNPPPNNRGTSSGSSAGYSSSSEDNDSPSYHSGIGGIARGTSSGSSTGYSSSSEDNDYLNHQSNTDKIRSSGSRGSSRYGITTF